MRNINIEFTVSGENRLKELTSEINNKIIENIRKSKYAPGDDFIEITASDIDNVAMNIRFVQPSQSNFKQIIFTSYIIIGVFLIFIGIFLDELKIIIAEDPTRLMFIVMGLIFSIISLYFSFSFKNKQKIEEELYMKNIERNKIRDLYTIMNEKKNEVAQTQYNDLKGTSALDFHKGLSELQDIFNRYSINTYKYRPFGLSFYKSSPNNFDLNLLAIIDSNVTEKNLKVVSIAVDLSEEEFNKLYKRYHSIIVIGEQKFNIINELTIGELVN